MQMTVPGNYVSEPFYTEEGIAIYRETFSITITGEKTNKSVPSELFKKKIK